jgi:secondary thiamine-phosphate synthase enzyme
MILQETLNYKTPGRGSMEITRDVNNIISKSNVRYGLCNVFIMHTSASLMLSENADPAVRSDLETFMNQTVPDGDPMFRHTTEGPDDMAAHVRTVLTGNSLTIPVANGQCALGTWQGIYLWEHRTHPHNRKVMVTVYGE